MKFSLSFANLDADKELNDLRKTKVTFKKDENHYKKEIIFCQASTLAIKLSILSYYKLENILILDI